MNRVRLAYGLFALALGSQVTEATELLNADFDARIAAYDVHFTGDASAAAVNIRAASEFINTSVDHGFDMFFGAKRSGNHFLVLGDEAGGIWGEPNGSPAGGFSMATFDLGSFGAGLHALSIEFDYAFDTNFDPGTAGKPNVDDFLVRILDGSGAVLNEILRFDDVLRNDPSRKGTFDGLVAFGVSGSDRVSLAFSLNEYNGTGSSAVGIDNLRVLGEAGATTRGASEPGALTLLGLGLLGLGFVRTSQVCRTGHA